MEYLVPAPPAVAVVCVTEDSAPRCLIIRLIIQTIRLDPSGSVWTWESHRDYIADAAGRFPDVDFSAYEIAFIVAPEIGRFPLSPAFIARAGDGPAAPGGAIHHAVTFGADSYTNRFINLVHETGHLLGLPDLYRRGSDAEDSRAGCWDIMSDIFRSVSFMAWHRYKSGWLPPARAVWIAEDTPGRTVTLHPLSRPEGVAMLVVPVDDPVCPTKVFVVELAEPVIGNNGELWGEGVLVSTVDASIPSGEAPVVVIPRCDDPGGGRGEGLTRDSAGCVPGS
jgi:M6 family metalloprotease-like protein